MDLIKNPKPIIFDEFFASGLEESVSPFLKKSSRKWGAQLPLKSSLFSLFLLLLSFSFSFLNLSLSYLLLSFVFFFMGFPSLIYAMEDLQKLEINIDILMTLSAFIALVIGSPFEGALLLVLFALAGALENSLSYKTRAAVHHLHQCMPSTAYLLQKDGSIREKAIADITVGMNILVKSGETIPVDGKVIEGSSSISIAHLTGEPLPITVKKGSEVPGGALNLEGTLSLSVTKEGGESTILQILKLITSAEERKPKIERFLYHFGKIYSGIVLLLTLLFALFLPLIFSLPYFGMEGSIYRALTFMVAASPCALILAIPSAYLSTLSAAAKKGVLLKGGFIIDALTTCRWIAFDKTGTLTTGELTCTKIEPLNQSSFSPENALQIAASLEKASSHPIALSILKAAEEKKIPLIPVEDFLSVSGFGVQGKVKFQNKTYLTAIGKPSFIEKQVSEKEKKLLQKAIEKKQDKQQLLTCLLVDNALFLFYFQDSLRKQSKKLLHQLLTEHQLKPIILTGDIEENAKAVAQELSIKEIYAQLRPEDKVAKVAHLSHKYGLAMVGDGVNDAAALARATVGISMGGKGGSATAVNASDVILLNNDIAHISWLFHKAHKTLFIVKENLFLALIVILFASFPALLGILPLWLAVILHEGGTILVGLNSLRLLRK